MTQINYTQSTFHKGIIDENLSARADTNFLIQGANDIVNMNITPQGTIDGRNGLVADKIEASLLNKSIDITTVVPPFNYKILNTSKYLIHGYTLNIGSNSNIYVKYSNDYGNTWDIKTVEFQGDPIDELLLVNNNDYILLLAKSIVNKKINIYRTNNCVDWTKIQEINTPINTSIIENISFIKSYNNVFYFIYTYDVVYQTKEKYIIVNRLENNGENYSYKIYPNNKNIDESLINFYILDENNLYIIKDNTNISKTIITKYNYINNEVYYNINFINRYLNTFIKNNSDYFLAMINENKKNIYKIEIINNHLTENLIKSYTDKNIEKLIYNSAKNNWIIFFDNNTIEISNTNKIEEGTYVINNVNINNYYNISINNNNFIFSTTQYQEGTPPIKHYISLLGFEPLSITQQKNISVDDNLYSVIIYQNITTKERYLQLYNINNGNYIAYKFNLSYNNSLTNENFDIISLIKLTNTQLLFTTSLAWYVIDVPKQKIEYNNDLRYFKITNEFRSRYGIQNYLFQATEPADPVHECDYNFIIATIDPNKIKTIIDKDTCTRFTIINTDKNDKDGIISINTRVRIYVEVPANNNVMLKQFWKANIYKHSDINSFENNNQTIFFCRGLYILTNDNMSIIGDSWNKGSFNFEVSGIVIDGASVNNELLTNYLTNQYGLNGSFDNGDIILFNNFNLYCYYKNNIVSFKPMYPNIINRFQNRLVCNNTLLNNYQIYLSEIGNEYTFFATNTEPSSAFSFSLDGNEKILQIETGKKFLISSVNGSYLVSNPLNENLKPTNFNINKISNIIINKNVKPVEYDDKIFYIQDINNNIKFIMETDKIGNVIDGIANISNMDLFRNAVIIDMLSCPNLNNNGSYLFVLFKKDEKIEIAILYSDKNQEIMGWTRWESTILNVPNKDLLKCKLIYHNNTLYISYNLNTNDKEILYFKLDPTALQDKNILDEMVPIEQKVITTPISIIDPAIGNIIYKPYKLSNINVSIKNNTDNPIDITCNDVIMNNKTNNIYELKDFMGDTGYLNKLTFKVLSNNAKLELLGWQTTINYQGDTIK